MTDVLILVASQGKNKELATKLAEEVKEQPADLQEGGGESARVAHPRRGGARQVPRPQREAAHAARARPRGEPAAH